MHYSHIVRAAVRRYTTKYSHFFIRPGLKRDRFSIREVYENLEALGGRDRELCDSDRCGKKTAVRCYDVKRASVVKPQLKILGVRSVEKSELHEPAWNFGDRGDRPVHDNGLTPGSICDVEGV